MPEPINIKVPKIRFNGLETEWKENPIGEIVSEIKRPIILKDNQRYELITVKRRNAGVVPRGSLLGREILVKNYSQVQAGDFVISKRQVIHGATGIIPSHLNGAIVSNEYLIAVGNSSISTEFLTLLATLPVMRKKFFLSSYGVDIEKMVFEVEDWKKRGVSIPSVVEQTQICGYFREIDQLIALRERKHDKLVTLKKAMLQKMFPKPGTAIPEIRFKGFSGDWEERPFNQIATRATQASSEPSLPRLEYEDIISSKGILNKDLTKKKSSKKGLRFQKGNVLFGKLRPYLKNWLLADFDGIAVGDFWVLEACSGVPSFLYYLIQTDAFETVANQSAGSKMPRSDWKLVSSSVFVQPSKIAEQQRIGHYFHMLDSLISQYVDQIAKLKQLKSASLERMFV